MAGRDVIARWTPPSAAVFAEALSMGDAEAAARLSKQCLAEECDHYRDQLAGAVDDVGRLRGWITHLDTMTNDPRLRAACASALRGDEPPAGGQ